MASSGALGIAIFVAGTAAIVAGAVLSGGTLAPALAPWLTGGGALLLGAGGAITAASQQPDPITQVYRQTTTTDDPQTPHDLVYGRVVKGAMRSWQGVGGTRDKFSGVDDIIAPHACEEVVAIQVGEWYFPIVTDEAGEPSTANGHGLILNSSVVTGRPSSYDNIPSDWYVPVVSSPWKNNDQSTVDLEVPHIIMKIYYGDQTATDSHMATIFGTDYSSIARKFIGHTVAHVIFIARDNLGTAGSPPTIKYEIRGKNDIRTSAGIGSEDYRDNAVQVFVDYTREKFGLGPSDYVNMDTAETECDDTSWSGSLGSNRYEFHGVIREDMEPLQAMRLIASHFAGGWAWRGDKIVLWTGTAKTAWSGGPIVPDDYAGPLRIEPPDEDSWVNTLQPHSVARTVADQDGLISLHGKMEPTKQEVTTAAYVTEDGGDVLVQDIKFQGCPLTRRAKFMAWTVLTQRRLGATYSRRFKKRLMVLEVGDVVAVDDPEWVPDGTEFRVVRKAGPDPRDFSVDLTFARYDDGIYDPDATPTEDAIGVVPRRRSADVPAAAGLSAEILEDSVQVLANGAVTVDVVVSWTLPDNLYVVNSGSTRVAWKKGTQSWPKKATTTSGDQVEAVLPGILVGVEYDYRVRHEGSTSAGRSGRPRGEWTADTFTISLNQLGLEGAAGSLNKGGNLVVNGDYQQGPPPGDTAPLGWEFVVGASGSIAWSETGGFSGSACVVMNVESHSQRARPLPPYMIPVEIGEQYLHRIWTRVYDIDSGTARSRLEVLYYDIDRVFVTGENYDLAIRDATAVDSSFQMLRARHTVPANTDIVYARVQAQATYVDTSYGLLVDKVRTIPVTGGSSSLLDTVKGINVAGGGDGSVWTNVRRVNAGKPRDPVRLKCEFYAQLGDRGLSSPNELDIKFVRWDVDGTSNETEIKAAAPYGDSYGPFSPSGSDGPWFFYSVRAFDSTSFQGPCVYACQFRGNANGMARVRYRSLEWKVEDEQGEAGET